MRVLAIIKMIFSLGCCCFLVTGLCSPCVYADNSKRIIIAWEPWEPYQFQTDNGGLSGLDIEITEAVMKNMRGPFKWQETPWKRCLKDVSEGYLHAGLAASITPEREKWALFSEAYRTESAVLFVKKGTTKNYPIKNLRDIVNSSFRLGVTRGYYYGDEFDELIKVEGFKKHVEEVSVNENNYKKLLKGRIDGFLADPVSGTAGLKSMGLFSKVEIHPMKVYDDNLHILFSKKLVTPGYVEKFNESLRELKKNGIHQKILDKYLK